MNKRLTPGSVRTRAKTPEDKAEVRNAFIVAGRRLLANQPHDEVSLRRIAAEAGYTPGTIYQYFDDYNALLFAIREIDLKAAIDQFETIAVSIDDPVERVRALARGSAKYWLQHPDQFDVLFSRPPYKDGVSNSQVLFGRSAVVRRALKIYYSAVDKLFETSKASGISSRFAADTLIATTYGIVAFPRGTHTMRWSNQYRMAECAIDALVDSWLDTGPSHDVPKSLDRQRKR
ncbi:TetR/AcrR family transcriptional regulator [Burkholderia sp. Ac-20345]|uniref:TetR/AcrR family transcriptional regulator n=1 Tax=Burkholderia sp. Ac-20345 TaxID=2703891 RepID=UPI00197C0D2E|nr:TetR/AcrR family transcriptional regulator [Burkholderia sp. Ac-20345]MBN3782862.1 TetR/AcrR family transcriptional regulator [Burkholderia sp. Ac-20345]